MYIVVLTVLVLAPMGAAPMPPLNSCLGVVCADEEPPVEEEEVGEGNFGIGIRKSKFDRRSSPLPEGPLFAEAVLLWPRRSAWLCGFLNVLPKDGECLNRGLVITLPKVEFGEGGGCGGCKGACDGDTRDEEEALATGFLSHEDHEDELELPVVVDDVEVVPGYRGVGDNSPDSIWDFDSWDGG
jgi:hypothetical protein